MGALLDQWMADNSAALARLQPGGGAGPMVGGPPPPAFPGAGQGAMAPPPPTAFQGGQGPVAAPVDVQGTPGAEVGQFGPYQAPPMQQPAFEEQAAGGGGGPGLGSTVMDAIEAKRDGAVGAEEGAPPVEGAAAEGEADIELPAEGEGLSAEQVFQQSPEAVDKAVDVLEEQTGKPVEQLYEQQTGNPPPANMKRREMGNFLLEFGLNLLAQPGGMSPAQEFGQAAQQTIRGRTERRTTATAVEREERQAQHERNMELKEFGLKRREIESIEAGQIERFVTNDGRMMQWDPIAGTATAVLGAEGEPITGVEGRGTGTQAEFVFTTVIENQRKIAELNDLEFTPEMEIVARRQAEAAMRNIRPEGEFDEAAARVRARDAATELLKVNEDFKAATGEEQEAMIARSLEMNLNWEKYGVYQFETPSGPDPDPARIPEGSAVPITDGNTGEQSYWIRDGDGVRKLTLVEARARGLPEF